MNQLETKNLVVDADIAFSSSQKETKQSINSREFLESMRICGHRITLSPDILKEWTERGSYFALDWLATMTENNQIFSIADASDERLREQVCCHAPDIHIFRIMRKDVHLLEAALKSDMTISSMDKRVHFHFCAICKKVEEIQDVVWVNPDVAEEKCIDWLRRGAPNEAKRQLGYQHRGH